MNQLQIESPAYVNQAIELRFYINQRLIKSIID